MRYEKIVGGRFIERPNRFVAIVEIHGKNERVHVKNTGRCKELLIPGATVFLEDFEGRMGTRKMRYSLVAVVKNDVLINMDSQAPNKVVYESLRDGRLSLPSLVQPITIKPETTFQNSRFDFFLQDTNFSKAFVEVKGVTLENGGIASFPDAPTVRGAKHVEHLVTALEYGYLSYLVFIVQMKRVRLFTLNFRNDPVFAKTVISATQQGVKILAFDCQVTPTQLLLGDPVPISLEN